MIAVSIFISQDEAGEVHIRSLAEDDVFSKSIERMLCEQAANTIKFIDASANAAKELHEAQVKP